MIAIVSSNPTERAAFAALCKSRGWPHLPCDSVREFRAVLRHTHPAVVLMRNKLTDGYSDDILGELRSAGLLPGTRTMVLIPAGTASGHEARQVALGADGVHRDPVRIDVLLEYLARFRERAAATRNQSMPPAPAVLHFAGAAIDPADRTATANGRSVILTPRELAFIELLLERHDQVVSYQTMYAELLGRQFAGETSNMRVLLGKLGGTLRRLGLQLREWIEVIPKSGYRYRTTPPRRTKRR